MGYTAELARFHWLLLRFGGSLLLYVVHRVQSVDSVNGKKYKYFSQKNNERTEME